MSSESKEGLLAVCGSLMGLSTAAVGLRFLARKKTGTPVMADDMLAVGSLFTFIGAATIAILMVHYHMLGYSTSPELGNELSEKLQIAWDVLGTTSMSCSKLSALYFYKRIFSISTKLYWITISAIVVVILWLFVFQFLTGFQCGTHFSALWNGHYKEYCTISFPYLYGFAISDFILDVWIVCLPIPKVLRLNAPLSKKLATLSVFLLTFICVFASGARMVTYINAEREGPSYYITHDHERVLTLVFFYTMLETGLSLVAVTLPSLWCFVSSIRPDRILRSLSSKMSLASIQKDDDKSIQKDDDKSVQRDNDRDGTELDFCNMYTVAMTGRTAPGEYRPMTAGNDGGATVNSDSSKKP
ncbi:hypothetical protein AB5N19_03766 [Seiridium cardinale]